MKEGKFHSYPRVKTICPYCGMINDRPSNLEYIKCCGCPETYLIPKKCRELVHKNENCPLVAHRIACDECGYPMSEARYLSVDHYKSGDCTDKIGDEQVEKPELKLSGEDGNAFFILGKAQRVARENGLDWDAIKKEATSDDYDHLLRTMMEHFEVV